MFRILFIFAIWIGWSSYHPIRGKSVAPSMISMTDVIKRTDIMRKKMALKELLSLAKEKHGDKFDYSLINDNNYIDTKHLVFIKCCKHNYVFSTRLGDHIRGNGGCPICKSEAISFANTGKVRAHSNKLCGVGINDVPYIVSENNEAYVKWRNMIHRCYDEKITSSLPSYKGCSVCDEWLLFSNFKVWFDKNHIDGYELDKDILVKGNKVYSPDTCCFIPPRLNKLLLTNKGRRNGIVGVLLKGEKYEAYMSMINEHGKRIRKHIGYYSTAETAFEAYRKEKEAYVKDVATKLFNKGMIEEKVYIALIKYKVEITD